MNSNVKKLKTVGELMLRRKAVVVIVFVVLSMLILEPKLFFAPANLLQILNSISIYGVAAAGVTFVIISGASDMSIGSNMALSGIITIFLINEGVPILLAMIITVLMGACIGFINGFLVVHQKIEPFIITYGMQQVLRGIAHTITNAEPVYAPSIEFMEIANGKLFGVIPNLIIIMAVAMVIGQLILRYTAFGRNVYAVGDNFEVATYAGINARRIKWSAFIICGAVAAFAGILFSSLLNSGSSLYAETASLQVMSSAVVGGTTLGGGSGNMGKSFVGLLSLTIITKALEMLGINQFVSLLIQGIVIVVVLWLDVFSLKLKREAV